MLLTIHEAANQLKCQPVSLRSKRFRAGIGLVATKIGRSVRFQQADVERVIRQGREKLPAMPGEDPADAGD